ncbi:MAG: ketoreductase domain-containing protein, partial [Alphaproteobacteria bacterium]
MTGGLSGFGLASAGWLAEHGVSDLILVGRRGLDTPGAREALEDFTSKGIRVQALACDISDPTAVARLLEQVHKTCPPITGVLHAATVYDDALVQNLDAARMEAVLAPKLMGAWNLHQATLGIPLEHFVLYSSIATVIGNPGQANYVAANAGLEGLAEMRRHMGLPAVCVGWGPIGDTGYLSRNEAVRDGLSQSLGKPPMNAQDALNELERLLSQEHTLTVANFNWNKLAGYLPSFDQERFSVLNRFIEDTGVPEWEDDFRTLIAGKSTEEVTEIVKQLVIKEVAQV